jgi:cleavage and polyadenylation specificity factor subunit 1
VTHCAPAYLTQPSLGTQPFTGSVDDAAATPHKQAIPDLVVVRGGTSLEVYVVTPHPTDMHAYKLEILVQRRLFGVVESIAVLPGRSGRSGFDALLLTFRDAKLSVLQWDATVGDFAPSSLHYFEGDESLKAGRESFPRGPMAFGDPAGKCAAVIMLRHQLAVLPAFESEYAALGVLESDALQGNATASNNTAAVGNSYVDNLGKIGVRDVRDAAFLYGVAEPTLLVLHEGGDPTWAGALKVRKDTCALSALSLNISSRRHPKIWGAMGVPADARSVVAAPCGGAVVITPNVLLYYNQGVQTGAVVNAAALPASQPPPPLGFDLTKETPGDAAAKYAREHATQLHPAAASVVLKFCDASYSSWNMDLDGASIAWLSRTTALLGLRSGQLLLAEIQKRSGNFGVKLARAGAAPPTSCIAALGPSMIFVGSASGDSLLLGYHLGADNPRQQKEPRKPTGVADRSTDEMAAARGANTGGTVKKESAGEQSPPRHPKRRRLEGLDDDVADEGVAQPQTNVHKTAAHAQDDDDDQDAEALLYGVGEEIEVGSTLRCWLHVLDSLTGIAPLRSLTSSGPASGSTPPYLVACCGQGRNGALAVLRRSVALDVVTEVPLPGVCGAWAIGALQPAPEEHDAGGAGGAPCAAFLLLSFPGCTRVLSTGDDMREVTDELEFAGDTPTIAAATLPGSTLIVQAFPQGIRLLDGGEQRHDLMVAEIAVAHQPADNNDDANDSAMRDGDGGETVLMSADVSGGVVLLRLSSGEVHLVRVDSEGRIPKFVHVGRISSPVQGSKATACCMYEDRCGWLRQHVAARAQAQRGSFPIVQKEHPGQYCAVAYDDGSLAMWDVASFQGDPIWLCTRGLDAGATLLVPSQQRQDRGMDAAVRNPRGTAAQSMKHERASMPGSLPSTIVEMRLESFPSPASSRQGQNSARNASSKPDFPACAAPVLIALTSDDRLLVYRGFCPAGAEATPRPESIGAPGSTSDSFTNLLRFRRLQLDIPPLIHPATPPSGAVAAPRITSFKGLGEHIPYSGVFVAGTSSVWLIAARGSMVAHPAHNALGPDVHTASFTPFHDINCPHGCIVVHAGARSSLSIAGLPRRQRLDGCWPRQKIGIKATPLRVCVYPEARLFALAVARDAPYRAFLPEEQGGEPQASYSYALADAAAAAAGTMTQHELRFVQPGTWAALWRYPLLPGESACCVESVHLRDATTGATVPMIAMGTAFGAAGEDYPCSGRVLLFEVVRGSGIDRDWEGRLAYAREFKGPVMGVCTLGEGNLLLSTGNRLEVCTLSSSTPGAVDGDVATATSPTAPEDGDAGEAASAAFVQNARVAYRLQRSAFYDGPTLLTSVSVVKSFALLGDVLHGVQFVRYREEGRQLALLSKDFGASTVRVAQFLIAGSSLHFVSADGASNLLAYTYDPAEQGSWKGQRLVQWGALHVGAGIGAMTSVRIPQIDPGDATVRQAVLCGTDLGGLSAVLPLAVGEHMLRSRGNSGLSIYQSQTSSSNTSVKGGVVVTGLKVLQRELAVGAAHAAGLNPAAFRRRYAKVPLGSEGTRPFGVPLGLGTQGLLDGDLLMEYCRLPREQQQHLAAKAGLHREDVLEVLSNVMATACLF